MAVDTRSKRSSAMFISSPWRSLLPVGDGTVGQEDRQHAAYLYNGISATEQLLIVGGCWVAGDVFLPGFKAGEGYLPGFQQGDVYQPGFQAGQRVC